MIPPLTSNTQAILLLTAPLMAGREETSVKLLSLGEYNRLARLLREKQKQPADLIGTDSTCLIDLCAPHFGKERLETLLGRGFLLSQAVERWTARNIWVISRADACYPKRLKSRLKEDAPPVLYGCGEIGLLEKGGLAVVGSRHVDDELISFTENVGRLTAKTHRILISGGAKGIDRAAMNGALLADGNVAGVMADSLERAALVRDNREPLIDGRLVLISPYDPAAGFNVGHAMQRNKVVYALADAGLVVTSDFETGGTWAGAIEQLERLRLVPIFVKNGKDAGRGNAALIHHGGVPWPNPDSAANLEQVLSTAIKSMAEEPKQEALSFAAREQAALYTVSNASEKSPGPQVTEAGASSTPAEELFKAVREILRRELTNGSLTEEQIANRLDVAKPQAKRWLARLVDEGAVEKVKKTKPAQYRVANVLSGLL